MRYGGKVNVLEYILRSPQNIDHERLHEAMQGFAYRVVDLRKTADALEDAAKSALVKDGNFQFSAVNDSPAEFAFPLQAPLPVVAQPQIGMYGWYLFSDTTALLVKPWSATAGVIDAFEVRLWVMFTEFDGTRLRSPFADEAVVKAWLYLGQAADDPPVVTIEHQEPPEVLPEDTNERFDAVLGAVGTGSIENLVRLVYAVVIANSIALADPGVVEHTDTPPRLLKASVKRKRPKVARWTVINLPGLRYDGGAFHTKTGKGVAWHMVRGHYRTLSSAKFSHKQGQKVFVRPHARGHKELGVSTGSYRLR